MRVFFDSSAFAKRYVEEPGSESVDLLCSEATDLALSIVCVPEVISALNRRVREGDLSRQQYEQAKQRLSEDVRDAAIVDITPSVIGACIAILEASSLRAMDALHVACALQWEPELFVSADRKQITAAKRANLPVRLV